MKPPIIRHDVEKLAELGRFPDELEATDDDVRAREQLLLALSPPTSDAEAALLLPLLGEDDLFGLAWSIITLVESSPGWPDWHGISRLPAEWREILSTAAMNAGHRPPA